MKKILLLLTLILSLFSCEKVSMEPSPIEVTGPIDWDGVKRGDVRYEIFVRSYYDSDGDGIGDINGLTTKIPMISDWGIKAIWLMPINPSPSYHGYDVQDYKDINPEYGTLADFDRMVKVAHNNDMEVIIDMVINHTSKSHPWFLSACQGPDSPQRNLYIFAHKDSVEILINQGKIPSIRNYHSENWHIPDTGDKNYRYYGLFSSWMPDFNPENPAVMDSLLSIGKFWIDRGVDGFRLDAIKHIYQIERGEENYSFLKRYRAGLLNFKSDFYLVGEVLDDYDVVAPFLASIPACFNFNSWWKLSWALTNSTGKYYTKDMNDCVNAFINSNPDYIHVTKLSNHDEDRTMTVLSDNKNRAKMAALIIATMPGQPYFYYGEEIGMRGSKSSGDENVREPYLWSSSASGNTTWWTPRWNTSSYVTPLDEQLNDKNSIASCFIEALQLRNIYKALSNGSISYPDYNDVPDGLMIYKRVKDSQRILIAHNLGSSAINYQLDVTALSVILSRNGATAETTKKITSVNLPSLSTIIIEY